MQIRLEVFAQRQTNKQRRLHIVLGGGKNSSCDTQQYTAELVHDQCVLHNNNHSVNKSLSK